MADKQSDPLVSVIIPTYRRPALLQNAVRSVLAQTFTAFELIIIDDSPEASARSVAEELSDPRLVYLASGQNRGAAAARNTGIARARGRFIAFLDDDDLWHPDFLQKMVPALAALPEKVGVLHCAVEDVGRSGEHRVSRPRHRGDVHGPMLRGEKSGGIIALVRREVFSICGAFDESLPSAQDWDLWIRVSARFHFDYIPDVLATVRDCGERISSDPRRAIAARERILEKYAAEFDRCPEARVIHLKRLAKLNSFIGRWGEVGRRFREAARGRPAEWGRALAWLVCERPFVSRPGDVSHDPRYGWAALLFSAAVAVYSQTDALRSAFVVNDDVCQHLWWMRSFQESGLFSGDILARYAQSLQNWGVLGLYRCVAWFMDPVAFAAFVPLVLLPWTCLFVFRTARRLSGDDGTGLFVAMGCAVTYIYLQHMAGGHAHSFGYPLLAAFLYYFLERRQTAMAVTLGLSALFFPVIFALGMLSWLFAALPQGPQLRAAPGAWRWRPFLAAAFFGLAVLGARLSLAADPLIGNLLSRREVAGMPELTAAGRWTVWPVENVLAAMARFAEDGLFLFRAFWKSALPLVWKKALFDSHIVLAVLVAAALPWWFRRAPKMLTRFFLPVTLASLFLYLWAAFVVLKLYAPDRYVSYTAPLLATFFVLVPAGASVSALAPGRREVVVALLLVALALCAPLVKGAGLEDYSRYRPLYGYLATLPREAVVAASPALADGIPLFAKRSVLVNHEMSVPLYDRYWQTVSARTRDFLRAYYATDLKAVTGFMQRYGLARLVIDREDFSPKKMAEGIYFEPFGSEIRQAISCKGAFALLRVPAEACLFRDGQLCVVSRESLERFGDKGFEGGRVDEDSCEW